MHLLRVHFFNNFLCRAIYGRDRYRLTSTSQSSHRAYCRALTFLRNTFHFFNHFFSLILFGGPTWNRTRDLPVMSRWLYQLSYGPRHFLCQPATGEALIYPNQLFVNTILPPAFSLLSLSFSFPATLQLQVPEIMLPLSR